MTRRSAKAPGNEDVTAILDPVAWERRVAEARARRDRIMKNREFGGSGADQGLSGGVQEPRPGGAGRVAPPRGGDTGRDGFERETVERDAPAGGTERAGGARVRMVDMEAGGLVGEDDLAAHREPSGHEPADPDALRREAFRPEEPDYGPQEPVTPADALGRVISDVQDRVRGPVRPALRPGDAGGQDYPHRDHQRDDYGRDDYHRDEYHRDEYRREDHGRDDYVPRARPPHDPYASEPYPHGAYSPYPRGREHDEAERHGVERQGVPLWPETETFSRGGGYPVQHGGGYPVQPGGGHPAGYPAGPYPAVQARDYPPREYYDDRLPPRGWDIPDTAVLGAAGLRSEPSRRRRRSTRRLTLIFIAGFLVGVAIAVWLLRPDGGTTATVAAGGDAAGQDEAAGTGTAASGQAGAAGDQAETAAPRAADGGTSAEGSEPPRAADLAAEGFSTVAGTNASPAMPGAGSDGAGGQGAGVADPDGPSQPVFEADPVVESGPIEEPMPRDAASDDAEPAGDAVAALDPAQVSESQLEPAVSGEAGAGAADETVEDGGAADAGGSGDDAGEDAVEQAAEDIAEDVAAAPAAPGEARVFVHAPATVAQSRIDAVVASLRAAGYNVQPPIRVNFNVSSSNVRFFRSEDAGLAAAVAGALPAGQSGGGATARDFTYLGAQVLPSTVELWLSGDGSGSSGGTQASQGTSSSSFTPSSGFGGGSSGNTGGGTAGGTAGSGFGGATPAGSPAQPSAPATVRQAPAAAPAANSPINSDRLRALVETARDR